MKKRAMNRAKPSHRVLEPQLQRVARIMLPFYRAIAISGPYARQWSEAVTGLDLDRMVRLLTAVSPRAAGLPLGTNSIGYFVAFPQGDRPLQWTNGTTIPPGTTQSVFEPRVHRAIARAVFPLYLELARNRSFAAALERAVLAEDTKAVRRMVRCLVKTPALVSIGTGLEEGGLSLSFRYRFTEFLYRNLLFRETV